MRFGVRTDAGASTPRHFWTIAALLGVVVLLRSAVFVFWDIAHIDANQGVIGLMGKHIAEGRAFPVFMYGQTYQLAVEAWLAAPLFWIAGVSVAALKLPLLAINLAVVVLLLWVLVRDVGLSPIAAGFATLFFALPAPGTAATLLEASGGTLEPFLYVLLIWVTRKRPIWCGIIVGFAFAHREFVVYGVAALFALDALRGQLFSKSGLTRAAVVASVATVVWGGIEVWGQYGPAMGPGTTRADLVLREGRSGIEIANRLCIAPETIPTGLAGIVTTHWPALYGTEVRPLYDFSIDSPTKQGRRGIGLVLGLAMVLAVAGVAVSVIRARGWPSESDACAYLILVGAFSVAGYVGFRCGVIEFDRMRYEMLSILGAVGIAAWYLRTHTGWTRVVWGSLVVLWCVVSVGAHGRLWTVYLTEPPVGGKRLVIGALDARKIRYGIADYSLAYSITFLTNERIIVTADNRVRILPYAKEVEAHLSEAVHIRRRPCDDGERVMEGIYFCRP